jgi:hypothetical protein
LSAVNEGNKILYNTMPTTGSYAFGSQDNGEIAYNSVVNSVHVGTGLASTTNSSVHDNFVGGHQWLGILAIASSSERMIRTSPSRRAIMLPTTTCVMGAALESRKAVAELRESPMPIFYHNTVLGGLTGELFQAIGAQNASALSVTLVNNFMYGSQGQWPTNSPTITSGITANHNMWPSPPAGTMLILSNPTTDAIGNRLINMTHSPGSPTNNTLVPQMVLYS